MKTMSPSTVMHLVVMVMLAASPVRGQTGAAPVGTFAFTVETTVPGAPDDVFDLATGDISQWWDHTMSENPRELRVDPFPGGAFMEVFDDAGNGVRHAVVTAAQRGALLRYEGPLGLAGHAIQMVTTWTFAVASTGSTSVSVEVHASGEVHENWPDIVEKTWHHFLIERFAPYATQHLKP